MMKIILFICLLLIVSCSYPDQFDTTCYLNDYGTTNLTCLVTAESGFYRQYGCANINSEIICNGDIQACCEFNS